MPERINTAEDLSSLLSTRQHTQITRSGVRQTRYMSAHTTTALMAIRQELQNTNHKLDTDLLMDSIRPFQAALTKAVEAERFR